MRKVNIIKDLLVKRNDFIPCLTSMIFLIILRVNWLIRVVDYFAIFFLVLILNDLANKLNDINGVYGSGKCIMVFVNQYGRMVATWTILDLRKYDQWVDSHRLFHETCQDIFIYL